MGLQFLRPQLPTAGFYFQVIHFTSHDTHLPIYIPRALNTGTCIQQGDLFYSAGLHRNRCTQEAVLATANTGKKSGEVLKNAGKWAGRVEMRKKSLVVSVACMTIYWPTPGYKGRTLKICVLTRWDFNFCVRSSPLLGYSLARFSHCQEFTVAHRTLSLTYARN